MTTWLRRLRGAFGMALTWAAGGAFLGGLIEMFVDPTGAVVDVWIPVLAYPGFVAGAVFSVVLGVAGRRRSFDELSLPRFAAWGAAGGALLGTGVVSVGIALGGIPVPWWIAVAILATTTVASAAAAATTLAVARMADDRAALDAGTGDADFTLTDDESRERTP